VPKLEAPTKITTNVRLDVQTCDLPGAVIFAFLDHHVFEMNMIFFSIFNVHDLMEKEKRLEVELLKGCSAVAGGERGPSPR
jgi:hypothetical protein